MKSVFAILALVIGSSAFAKTVTYDCVDKKDKTALATLKLDDKGDSTINGEFFGDEVKTLNGIAPEDYPVKIRAGHTLSTIDNMGDGDTQFFYADLPTNWDQPSLTLTVIEDNQRPRKEQFIYTDFSCTRTK